MMGIREWAGSNLHLAGRPVQRRPTAERLKKILPEYEIKDLPLTHPIFHSYFDLDGVVQVPGVAALMQGVTYEKGGVTPHYMGVEDKHGRFMVFLSRNCDLGDAWEWINDSRYPAQYGVWPTRSACMSLLMQ